MFSHNFPNAAVNGQTEDGPVADKEEEEEEEENWCRELGGAVVDFGHGATVTKVSFASDFSAVRLRGLPANSTPRSVVLLLATYMLSEQLRHDMVSEANVRVIPPSVDDPDHCQADVRVEDPHFATRLCAAVLTPATEENANAFSAVVVNSNVALLSQTKAVTTSSLGRVDSKKVHVSWHKPTRSVWLNFGSETIAKTVAERFQNGIYTVCGQQSQAKSSFSEPLDHGLHGAGRLHRRAFGYNNHSRTHNPVAWTVTLSDVPAAAGKGDILRQIPAGLRPKHIELGQRAGHGGAETDFSMASASIHSLLLNAGPLEWWEDSTGALAAGKRHKAKARFLHEADAARAVDMFNNQPLPFNRLDRLTVQLVHTGRLKVAAGIYRAVTSTILGHVANDWKPRHVQFTAYPAVHGFRVLKVEGAVRQDVAGAKATLERVLAGTTAMQEEGDGTRSLWLPEFSRRYSKGDKGVRIRCELETLEERHGVAFLYDWRRSELRVVGAPARQRKALDALAALVRDVVPTLPSTAEKTEVAITLDKDQLAWVSRGGYRAIVDAIGPDKARLDIVSTPKRIILVPGDEGEYRTVMDLLLAESIAAALPDKSASRIAAAAAATCAVCWTEAENAVRTPCQHWYCSDCFGEMCHASADSASGIRCVGMGDGDAAACDTPLALDTLHAHLSSAVLDAILETAFAAHVARHVDALRYCPTADCGQIYRVLSSTKESTATSSSSAPLFTCPACFSPVCRACHVAHEGVSCAEHKDRASGGYAALQVAKQSLGIKDCPKCGTLIEKIDGCNHMTCSACGTHICWVCLKVFSASRIYDHLNKVHGGMVDVVR